MSEPDLLQDQVEMEAAAELDAAARYIAAEGLVQGTTDAMELGAAMDEEAIAEEMEETESST